MRKSDEYKYEENGIRMIAILDDGFGDDNLDEIMVRAEGDPGWMVIPRSDLFKFLRSLGYEVSHVVGN